jgi:hypothetical protein
MAEVANNQSIRAANAPLLDKAIALLTELFDQHTLGGTYGKASVEIQFEAGKALYVRRSLEATHK